MPLFLLINVSLTRSHTASKISILSFLTAAEIWSANDHAGTVSHFWCGLKGNAWSLVNQYCSTHWQRCANASWVSLVSSNKYPDNGNTPSETSSLHNPINSSSHFSKPIPNAIREHTISRSQGKNANSFTSSWDCWEIFTLSLLVILHHCRSLLSLSENNSPDDYSLLKKSDKVMKW